MNTYHIMPTNDAQGIHIDNIHTALCTAYCCWKTNEVLFIVPFVGYNSYTIFKDLSVADVVALALQHGTFKLITCEQAINEARALFK